MRGASAAELLSVFRSRKIFLLLLLGFSSGLPLALTGATLQAWLTVEGVRLQDIGWFALVGQPYVYKFLWAPLMDRYPLPFLGRRRGWLLATQLALLVGVAWMGSVSPKESPWLLAALALSVAFLSASQDIVFDAYRADVLDAPERGAGAAVSVLGYRLAMLVSGGLALILVDGWLSWKETYWLMAVLMLIGAAATWAALEPQGQGKAPATLLEAVREPLSEFFSRDGAVALLVLIVLYKLGDAFAGVLTTVFLLRGAGFSLTDVGWANKWLGVGATILGLLHGVLNGAGIAMAGREASALLGIVGAIFVVSALVAAAVVSLRMPWARIVVRVAGSWTAATGLLLLGWSISGRA